MWNQHTYTSLTLLPWAPAITDITLYTNGQYWYWAGGQMFGGKNGMKGKHYKELNTHLPIKVIILMIERCFTRSPWAPCSSWLHCSKKCAHLFKKCINYGGRSLLALVVWLALKWAIQSIEHWMWVMDVLCYWARLPSHYAQKFMLT